MPAGWLSTILAAILLMPLAAAAGYNIRDFGATGDGQTMDTAAIQDAVDACTADGGGTVHFPPGTYRCGTVTLKDNVRLHIGHGATLLGTGDADDYAPKEDLPYTVGADDETSRMHHAILRGDQIEHVAIVGGGVIDANFDHRGGPKPIALKRCRFVTIRDVRILNSPSYALSLLGTDDVLIDGVTILNGYADGIDPDSCKNVRISNSRVVTRDDALCLKASYSLGQPRACEYITVTNCLLASVCNGFKLGTEGIGGFKRIAMSNCIITGYPDNRPAISGIALESVDGGVLEDVTVSNVTMRHVRAPIFIRLGNRGMDAGGPVAGRVRNVVVRGVTASRASYPCNITGIPSHDVEGVTLSDIRIAFAGSNPRMPADANVPEMMRAYPEAAMWGPLPAYGLYVRHARDVVLDNLRFTYGDDFWRLTTDIYRDISWPAEEGMPSHAEPGEAGPALVCDNVENLRVTGFDARPCRDGAPLMHFTDVRGAVVDGMAPGPGHMLLEAVGEQTARVHVQAAGTEELVNTADAPEGSVVVK